MIDHTYAVCAYKDSQYLEACIRSLMKQTIKSKIIIITSTPSEFIEMIANKFNISLYINYGQGGIVQDWNFAYSKADTAYITIAHQDDIYFKTYTEEMLKYIRATKKCLIYFTNYAEIRENNTVANNNLLRIKRIMLFPLRFSALWGSRFVRRRILSVGCPICCPSVTFVKNNLPQTVFKVGFQSDEDWEAWEAISKRKGSFIYNKNILMGHRIHDESETSAILKDKMRIKEDYIMFCKFWPKWFAKCLIKIYSKSEQSNEL